MLSEKLKSKRGISLPVAMAITTVLAILSASLIGIALNSITNTSSSVNERQAYLNARSALEYALAYYSDSECVPDVSAIGEDDENGKEYMVMKDLEGGTTSKGAKLVDSLAAAEEYTTYVVAEYLEDEENANDGGSLKLRAYAMTTDAFGKKKIATHLNATFPLNNMDQVPLLTNPTIDVNIDGSPISNAPQDAISLHIRQYPGQEWTPFFYIWTYNDAARMYELSKNAYGLEAGYKDYDNNSDYHYYIRSVQGDNTSDLVKAPRNLKQAFNMNQTSSNSIEPVGVWNVNSKNADDLRNGPASYFEPKGNGWYDATYYVKNGQVNYFNMIVTQKGATLNGNNGEWRPETQTSEMFHLWYLNADDKNIYLEFLKPGMLYRPGSDWNGIETLQDRMLVYVKNRKTAVHFKVKGVGDGDEGLTVPANKPKINGVRLQGSSLYDDDTSFESFQSAANDSYYKPENLEESWNAQFHGGKLGRTSGNEYFYGADSTKQAQMQYEGQGWWVANIATGKKFDIKLTYYDKDGNEYSSAVPVSPSSDDEAYIVADTAKNTIASYMTEARACRQIGLDMKSYSTIYVKSSDIGTAIAPRIDYFSQDVSSSSKRELGELINKIKVDYRGVDYEDSSFNNLTAVLTEATTLYNDDTKTPSSAEAEYKQKIADLKAALGALRTKAVDSAAYAKLTKLLGEVDAAVKKQEQKEKIYDVTRFGAFVDDSREYKRIKAKVDSGEILDQSGTTYTTTDVYDMYDELKAGFDDLEMCRLDKQDLKTLLDESKPYREDKRYKEEPRENLKTVWAEANNVYYNGPTNEKIYEARTNLQAAYENVVSNPDVSIDTTELVALVNEANAKITANVNCTEKSKVALNNAVKQAKKLYRDLEATQEKVDAEVENLKAALAAFTINKPADSMDKLESQGYFRIWIKGLNIGTTYNGYKDENGNFVSATNAYEIKSFTMSTYYNGKATGASYGVRSFNFIDGQNLAYIDLNMENAINFNQVSFYVNTIQNELGPKDPSTGKYTIVSSTELPFDSLEPIKITSTKDGVMFELDSLIKGKRTVTKGTVTTTEQEVEYTDISFKRGKPAILFVEGPAGLTAAVTEPDGTVNSYPSRQEGDYQVVRFMYNTSESAKQTFRLTSYDSETGEYVYTNPVNTQIGEQVVQYNEATKTANPIVRINIPYNGWDIAGDDTTYVGVKINGGDPVQARLEGTSYVYEGPYVEGSNFRVVRKYMDGIEKLMETGAMNITRAGELNLTYYANNAFNGAYTSATFVSEDVVSTSVRSILPKYTSKTAKSGSGSAANSVSGIVSAKLADDLLTAPLSVSVNDDEELANAKFDYFGQSGIGGEPTKNWGSTVIWIDTDNDYLRDIGTPYVYVWDNNGLPLNGPNPGWPATRLEDSSIYYVVVSASARGCVIKDSHNQKHGGNPSDKNNIYFDRTDSLRYNSSGSTKYYYDYAVCNYGIGRQGHCCLYTVIDNDVLSGAIHKNSTFSSATHYVGMLANQAGAKYDEIHKDWSYDRYLEWKSNSAVYTEDRAYYYNNYGRYYAHKATYLYRCKRYDEPRYYTYTQKKIDKSKMTATNLRMAFVGGSKIRIENASYYETYGTYYHTHTQSITSDFKSSNGTAITLDNQFGGAGGNKGSMGRVGDCNLTLMYDWFEYKIPVDQTDTYTYQLHGLRFDPDTVGDKKWYDDDYETDTRFYTPQIHDVYGNVWTVMNDIVPDHGMLNNVTVYTQSPDNVQIEDIQRIYFKKPSGSPAVTNVKVTASGVGGANVMDMSDNHDGQLYADIPAKTPFLVFEIEYDNGSTESYRTSLQGNDLIQFAPTLNDGYAWNNYVPNDVYINRQLYVAQGMYYGDVIVKEYNPDGTIKNRSDGSYRYASALYNNIVRDHFDNKGKPIIGSLTADVIGRYTAAYKNLYSNLAIARGFIDEGRHYPEFIHGGQADADLYEAGSIRALTTKYDQAVEKYVNGSIDEVERLNTELETAIKNIKISTDDKVQLILFDTEEYTDQGATVEVRYKLSEDASKFETKTVNRKTVDDQWTVLIAPEDENGCIYNVQFVFHMPNGNEIACLSKDAISMLDGSHIFVHQPVTDERETDTSYWVANAVGDYYIISDTEINEAYESKSVYNLSPKRKNVKEVMPVFYNETDAQSGKYKNTTLNFQHDCVVSGNGVSYTIKAGAYTFDKTKTGDKGPLRYKQISEIGWRPSLNLYSEEAKAYFTTPTNYGLYPEGKNAAELNGWVEDDSIVVGQHSSGSTVNMDVNSGSFAEGRKMGYLLNGGFYFRYSGNGTLYVDNDIEFKASSLKFAFSGDVDVTNFYDKHIYLGTRDDADEMEVTFLTDCRIKYADSFGEVQSFTIRAGSYIISRPKNRTDYIADLCDRNYWVKRKYVRYKDNVSEDRSEKGKFKEPTYSYD